MSSPTEESQFTMSTEREQAHEYRINVLATLKAIAWLSVPPVYILIASLGIGQWISDWAERGFLDGEIWEGFVLTPLMWAAIAAVVAVSVYSSIVKWIWDVWDRREKYAADGSPPDRTDELEDG